MEQEVVQTRANDIQSAVNELCGKLKKSPDKYNAVFFALNLLSNYMFSKKNL